tara:strand:- start:353 stop:505 length:153 start_codon:yes stop_codon:yes gene_type:complete
VVVLARQLANLVEMVVLVVVALAIMLLEAMVLMDKVMMVVQVQKTVHLSS